MNRAFGRGSKIIARKTRKRNFSIAADGLTRAVQAEQLSHLWSRELVELAFQFVRWLVFGRNSRVISAGRVYAATQQPSVKGCDFSAAGQCNHCSLYVAECDRTQQQGLGFDRPIHLRPCRSRRGTKAFNQRGKQSPFFVRAQKCCLNHRRVKRAKLHLEVRHTRL